MVRLASVEFTKLKNVRPGTRLSFGEAGAVLLGKNGTGKTTLLEYLVALCKADATPFLSDDAFDVSAVFAHRSGAVVSLRISATTNVTRDLFHASGLASFPQQLPVPGRARTECNITSPTAERVYRIVINDGRVELYANASLDSLCAPFPVPIPIALPFAIFRLMEILRSDATRPREDFLSELLLDFIGLQQTIQRFDEGLVFFDSLTAERSLSITLAQKDGARPVIASGGGKLPNDLADAFITNFEKSKDRTALAASAQQVKLLETFDRLCGFAGATVTAAIDETRRLEQAATATAYEASTLRFMFGVGKDRFSHSSLSFGQKRLLSYLYYIACNTQIGIADELVNGMHHEWIDYCLNEACEGRQMFYTSQNPLLLDFLSFETEAEVSERFVTCDWNEREGFIWNNLEPRIGEEFFRLYKAGIQHVSEILRTKGWW